MVIFIITFFDEAESEEDSLEEDLNYVFDLFPRLKERRNQQNNLSCKKLKYLQQNNHDKTK